KSGVYEDCLKRLFDKKLLADDGVIVCEQEKTIDIDFSLFDLVDQKIYGIKKVSYLKNAR
ncbi:MAG: RsmD family RNA methyltransferase, partial [Clostridia bacterium]|nr:RsmD family RNA methyltransferase [Clostridia bacterium]